MKKILMLLILVYFAFLAQSLIFENVCVFGVSPNILITTIILVSAAADTPLQSALLGAFGGMLTDALCGRLFGMHILAYMYLAVAAAVTIDKKNLNSPLITAWIGFVYTALFQLVYILAYSALGSVRQMQVSVVFVRGIFSALVSLIVIMINERLASDGKNLTTEEAEKQ